MQTLVKRNTNLVGNQKGLTLIELLAVIVVLGIVMAIAVPSVMGVIEKSRLEADKASLMVVKEAGLRYAMVNQVSQTQTGLSIQNELVDKGYLNSMPELKSGKFKEFTTFDIEVNQNTITIKVKGKATDTAPEEEIEENDFN